MVRVARRGARTDEKVDRIGADVGGAVGMRGGPTAFAGLSDVQPHRGCG